MSCARSKAYNLLAGMTLDAFRVQHPEVTSDEVLEALYDDRLTAFVEDDDSDSPTCAACDGELLLLGLLGARTHYRCRGCGLDRSV